MTSFGRVTSHPLSSGSCLLRGAFLPVFVPGRAYRKERSKLQYGIYRIYGVGGYRVEAGASTTFRAGRREEGWGEKRRQILIRWHCSLELVPNDWQMLLEGIERSLVLRVFDLWEPNDSLLLVLVCHGEDNYLFPRLSRGDGNGDDGLVSSSSFFCFPFSFFHFRRNKFQGTYRWRCVNGAFMTREREKRRLFGWMDNWRDS